MRYCYEYICIPRNVTVKAQNNPRNSRGIKVVFFVDGKEAYVVNGRLSTYSPTEEDIDAYVLKCCNSFKKLNDRMIQNGIDEDKVMLVLYVYKMLKKVEKKSGRVVWKL